MSISPSPLHDEVSSYPLYYPAMSLERSTIQSSDTGALRYKQGHRDNVASLFSPGNHPLELADGERPMCNEPPVGHRANPMSVSSLCSPPAYSSLPPHVARASSSTETHLSQSPSSTLSSPPYIPPSPIITVLGHRSPSPVARATPFLSKSPMPADGPAESSASGATSTSRKRPREDSEQPSTPGLPPDEYDERTKTWKHATGFRKDLTADRLTQPDAPTRSKRRSATFTRRTATPAAIAAAQNVYANPSPSNASQNSGSGESANEEEDELRDAADVAISGRAGTSGAERKLGEDGNNNEEPDTATQAGDLDIEEAARLEKKRRQNTQAARRSRIRKAEEVQKLQNRVADLEAEVIAGQQRLADAKRDAARLDTLHRNEVEFTGILKNSILNLVGDQKGSEAIGQASQRWRAITLPASPPAAGVSHFHAEQSPDMDYEFETKSGARAGS
jgi:hypothetical protein